MSDDLSADYRDPPAELLIFDHHTAALAEELAAFLQGWLDLPPADYAPADLQAAAAVMVARLGLRHGADRHIDRVVARLIGLV